MAKQSNKELYFAIRDLGYRPRIHHFRYHKSMPGPVDLALIRDEMAQEGIIAKGGMTVAELLPSDGLPEVTDGISAWCSPKDNYNKKIGVHIALARALEYLQNAKS